MDDRKQKSSHSRQVWISVAEAMELLFLSKCARTVEWNRAFDVGENLKQFEVKSMFKEEFQAKAKAKAKVIDEEMNGGCERPEILNTVKEWWRKWSEVEIHRTAWM
jgi:hypothetical protein